MMAAFNVTALSGLGYDNVQGLDNPTDARFAPQWWSAAAYEDASIQSTLSYLGGLGAYNQRTEIASAIIAYYSTNPSAAIETGVTAVATAYGAGATGNYGNNYGSNGANSWRVYASAAANAYNAASASATAAYSTAKSVASVASAAVVTGNPWGSHGNYAGNSHTWRA